jgi:hypothetical protein
VQAILPIHIAAGTLSVLAGTAALIFRKGKRAHRTAGSVFVISMTVMAVTAAVLGKNVGNFVAGGLTIYMVATAWVTARRRDNEAGLVEIAAFLAALACALAGFYSAYLYATGAKEPENPFIIFANLFVSSAIALAALGDLSVVLRRGISGAQRIARHLWRMCFGLLIAVGSFAAQGVGALPAAIPGPALLLASMLLVLVAMSYWLVRVLFTHWHGDDKLVHAKTKGS